MKTIKLPTLRTALVAAAAVVTLGAAAPAFAESRDWRGHEGREHAFREHDWREHERWEHRPYAYGYGYNYGYVAPAPVYPVAPSLSLVVPFTFR